MASDGAVRSGSQRGTVRIVLARSAQKKGPRKGCVPGGQRTTTLSGSDWTARQTIWFGVERLPVRRSRATLYPKRTAGFHANGVRFVVRRNAARGVIPGADPSTWIVFQSPRSGPRRLVSRIRHPFRRIVRREDREIIISGQGRFSGRFAPDFRPASGPASGHDGDTLPPKRDNGLPALVGPALSTTTKKGRPKWATLVCRVRVRADQPARRNAT